MGQAIKLIGRHTECGVLDRLVEAVRAGESRAIVVSGEAGVGKTALLDYVAGQASDCRVVRAAAVQSEMELPFAALHQVCAPVLDNLQRLPVPQREALRIAFGMTVGPAPDRFLVGLAVLGLLADVAEQRPLVCLVDDEQWLDRSSAQVLGFVARRVVAESVGLVFAARIASSDLAGLPELAVEGLRAADARAFLDAALVGPLDTRVRDRVVAETHGNPLALLELPRLTAQELAGGFGFLDAVRLSGGIEDGIEESFRRRIDVLPEQTCRSRAGAVSKLENQDDWLLSTLAAYIMAAGATVWTGDSSWVIKQMRQTRGAETPGLPGAYLSLFGSAAQGTLGSSDHRGRNSVRHVQIGLHHIHELVIVGSA